MRNVLALSLLLPFALACGREEGADVYAQVDPGEFHTCATTDGGRLACWGSNASLQLGSPALGSDPTPRFVLTGPLAVDEVESGATFSCGRLRGEGALCWGAGVEGARMVGGSERFVSLSVGAFACGVRAGGSVECWTAPDAAPVATPGLDAAEEVAVGSDRACAVGPALGIRCWPAPGSTSTLVTSTTGLTYHRITVGAGHGCALGADSVARCFGVNDQGQLGDGTTTPKAAPAVVLQGDRPTPGDRFTTIHAGNGLTCGVTESYGGFCWGQGFPYPVVTQGITAWQDVRPGGLHACGFARSDDGLYCWGVNDSGQLGNGRRVFAGLPVKVIDP